MASVRRNVLSDTGVRQQYARGAKLLKQEFLGPTTADLGITGPNRPVSTYDLFVVWHHVAMETFTPPSQQDRNAAHSGPVFLPWHRFMLALFELQLQRILSDERFGLPYWDWAADGERRPEDQSASPVWADDCMGGQGDPVVSGPFAFDEADADSWRVRLEPIGRTGRLRTTDRGLRRIFARRRPEVNFSPALPTQGEVSGVMTQSDYDAPPWSMESPGFRNGLEGWLPIHPYSNLHNRVHVWVGGDMLLSSSPNDPVFYLNHCNVDRIWASWLESNGQTYVPDQTAPEGLLGHRTDDDMYALLSDAVSPRQMLDIDDLYSYDTLVGS